MDTTSPAGPHDAPAQGPSLLTRFARLWSAPTGAFAPRLTAIHWLAPFLLLSVVHVIDSFVLGDFYRETEFARVEERMRSQDAQLSPEQRDQMFEMIESMASPGVLATTRVVTVGLLGFLLPALLLLFGVNFVLGGRARFGEVLAVVGLSSLVTLPRDVLLLPVRAMTGNVHVYAGPAALVSPESGALFAAMHFLDLFELYRIVPLALGLALVGAVSRQRATALVVGFHLLFALLTVGLVWLGEALGG